MKIHNIRNLLVFSLVLLIVFGGFIYSRTAMKGDEATEVARLSVSGSSYVEMSEEDLLNSPAIFKGKILGIKERTTRTAKQLDSEGNPFEVVIPVVVYNVEVTEKIKGLHESRQIVELSLLDVIEFDVLKPNEEYVFFTKEHDDRPNVFSPVSFNQGIFKRNNNQLESVMGEKILNPKALESIKTNRP